MQSCFRISDHKVILYFNILRVVSITRVLSSNCLNMPFSIIWYDCKIFFQFSPMNLMYLIHIIFTKWSPGVGCVWVLRCGSIAAQCGSSNEASRRFHNRGEAHESIVKLRQGSGKDRQGMALNAKGLKPLPRAYIKVGCHLPPTHHPDV